MNILLFVSQVIVLLVLLNICTALLLCVFSIAPNEPRLSMAYIFGGLRQIQKYLFLLSFITVSAMALIL